MRLALAFIPMIWLVACHDSGVDADVGAGCVTDRDCTSRCETGGEFPGGFCTLSCVDDRDCANGAICIAEHGGICLFQCDTSRDCDLLGTRYVCKDRDDYAGRRVGACVGQ